MIILGIETSCDETAAAVVEDGTKVISSAIASSYELHNKTGGVVPEVAARKQVESMIPVIDEAFKLATKKLSAKSYKLDSIDAIAVTAGPGLIGSLVVGVETAKAMTLAFKKPLVPVNHLVGHIYANFVRKVQNPKSKNQKGKDIEFPAIVLVVSGGHTDLVLMGDHSKFKWLGGTRDDAAGEAFDKVARMLGLGFPGGPAIEKVTSSLEIRNSKLEISLPRPMLGSGNLDMSFSGLKTAVLNQIRINSDISSSDKFVSSLAYEFQEAITDVLVEKTFKAARKHKVKSVLLAGGVAANQKLREKCVKYAGISEIHISVPDFEYCTDNAVMIASAAYFNYNPQPLEKVKADPSLSLR